MRKKEGNYLRKNGKIFVIFLLASIIIASCLFLAACGKQTEYTIDFESNGGSVIESITYTSGESFAFSVPEKKGFSFAGWYKSAQLVGDNYFTLPTDFAENRTLYAKWIIAEYRINYNLPVGAQLPVGSFTTFSYFDESLAVITDDTPLATEATRPGYDFLGWYSNPEFTGDPVTVVEAGTAKDLVVYPKFEAKENTITFVTNSSLILPDMKYMTNENVLVEDLEDLPHATFAGWFLTIDCSGSRVYIISRNSLVGDNTLYALWEPNRHIINYTLNGGEFGENYPRYYTSDGVELAYPAKTGFVFAGWFDNADFSGSAVISIPTGQEGEKSFYAKWIEVDFAIEYILNGGEFAGAYSQGYSQGESVSLVSPVKTGYMFKGWYTSASFDGPAVSAISSSDTGNKKFYAEWEIIEYTITFELNGGNFASGTRLSKYTVETPTINLEGSAYLPTKSGSEFLGWYTSPQFNTAVVTQIHSGNTGNKVFYAKYNELGFVVTFILNGGSLGNQKTKESFTQDTSVPLPSVNPTRLGYTFGGWFDDGATTIPNTVGIAVGTVGDRAIYAKWIPNEYTLTFNVNSGTMPQGHLTSYLYNEMTYLPIPTRSSFAFGGWYETANPTAATEGKLGAITPGVIGNKTLHALWLTPISTTNAQKMEVEHTNLDGKVGAGGSGSALGSALISTGFPGASNGGCIPWTWAPIDFNWEFELDRTVSDASLKVCIGTERGDNAVYSNATTAIYINGVLYEGAWSCTVAENLTFNTFTINLSGYVFYAGYNVITMEVLDNDAGYGIVFDYIELSVKANIEWNKID